MWSIFEHVRLLSRWDRADGLISGIQRAIRKGDLVLDAGCGSGICSLLSIKYGASRVVGVDRDPIDIAEGLAKENGLLHNTKFIQHDLDGLILEEYLCKLDVIVGMIYNNDPRRDEAQSSIALDLRKRYLKPDGRILPDKVRYLAYACQWPSFELESHLSEMKRNIDEMQGRYGFSFQTLTSRLNKEVDLRYFPRRDPQNGRYADNGKVILSTPVVFMNIDYYKDFFVYPDNFLIQISNPGRFNVVVWIQELWYQDILIFSNESLSYVKNVKYVNAGDNLTVSLDNEWRESNIVYI